MEEGNRVVRVDAAIEAMAFWCEKWEENYGRRPCASDAKHSSLLRRLLAGKPALEEPPPLRYSYPCYELGEGKAVEIFDIFEDNGSIVIDQYRYEQVDSTTVIDPRTRTVYTLLGKTLQKAA